MARVAILLLVVLAAGCASDDGNARPYSMAAPADNSLTASAGQPAPMDPNRSISAGNCSQPIDPSAGGNLSCQ